MVVLYDTCIYMWLLYIYEQRHSLWIINQKITNRNCMISTNSWLYHVCFIWYSPLHSKIVYIWTSIFLLYSINQWITNQNCIVSINSWLYHVCIYYMIQHIAFKGWLAPTKSKSSYREISKTVYSTLWVYFWRIPIGNNSL